MSDLNADTGGTSQRRGVRGDPWAQGAVRETGPTITLEVTPAVGFRAGTQLVWLSFVGAIRKRPVRFELRGE